MTPSAEATQQKIVKFVQELLLDEADRSSITPAIIAEKIEMIVQMNPKWGEGLNRESVSDELIRRFSVWIGEDTILRSDIGHVPWLSSSRKREWRYWQRYREWLERKLSFKAVEALDASTDRVLGLLEDPNRDETWDRRGLVVGHVQSGKTGNYTGLICKAADAGYKIIIVLAGLHNNLRAQTQMRLDEGFLGYETKAVPDQIRGIGVGDIDGDPKIRPNYATNRSEGGDFSIRVAQNLGISPEQRPWLFVVKKNATVLKRLHDWIRDHVANTIDQSRGKKTFSAENKTWEHSPARRVATHLPLLIIDDEADHASVDTGEKVVDEDGIPDENHQPTTINSWIRQIMYSFTRAAYVGYTATPFANIFIHERGATLAEGLDLFPSAFIISLAAPSNYIGPANLFDHRLRGEQSGGLPLVKSVCDYIDDDGHGGWMPPAHKNGHQPLYTGQNVLPPSLAKAIDAFILACAIRCQRGQEHEHSSMLIHVTRFTSVQGAVHQQVQQHLDLLKQRVLRQIDDKEILGRLRNLWEEDFHPTSARVRDLYPELCIPGDVEWNEVLVEIPGVLQDLHLKMINGSVKDALEYENHKGTGLKVIVIGGDKLARGLTLEGLCVSYFLRASRMYDTLMQMGRWFGYRHGYLDLCRLYTAPELVEWFGHITDAAEELREEFDVMAASGATPREYGLKVQSHSVLMVTSRLKMRTAKNLMLSFSGDLLETVALYRDPVILQKNFEALKVLISRLTDPENDPKRFRNGSRSEWKGYLWQNVPASDVVDFLTAYRTHPRAYRTNSALLSEFIQSMGAVGELTSWTIALIGGGQGAELTISDDVTTKMLERQNESLAENRYSIGRLMSPRDETIDLSEAEWAAALAMTRAAWHADPARLKTGNEPDGPSGPSVRKIRGFGAEGLAARPDKGLLFLYALDPDKAGLNLPKNTPPVIAFGISFPGSNSGLKIEYKVNNVLWEQEYGPAE
jgi:Z1 domain